jgi:hypothetical protein
LSTSQSRGSRAGSEPISSSRRGSNPGSSSKRKRSAFPSQNLQDSLGMIEASPNPRSRKQTRTAPVGSDTGQSVSLNSRGPPVNGTRGSISSSSRVSRSEETAPKPCTPARGYRAPTFSYTLSQPHEGPSRFRSSAFSSCGKCQSGLHTPSPFT